MTGQQATRAVRMYCLLSSKFSMSYLSVKLIVLMHKSAAFSSVRGMMVMLLMGASAITS